MSTLTTRQDNAPAQLSADVARDILAKATKIDERKEIRDQATAMATWACRKGWEF